MSEERKESASVPFVLTEEQQKEQAKQAIATAREELINAVDTNRPCREVMSRYVFLIYLRCAKNKLTASRLLHVDRRTLQRWDIDDPEMATRRRSKSIL